MEKKTSNFGKITVLINADPNLKKGLSIGSVYSAHRNIIKQKKVRLKKNIFQLKIDLLSKIENII